VSARAAGRVVRDGRGLAGSGSRPEHFPETRVIDVLSARTLYVNRVIRCLASQAGGGASDFVTTKKGRENWVGGGRMAGYRTIPRGDLGPVFDRDSGEAPLLRHPEQSHRRHRNPSSPWARAGLGGNMALRREPGKVVGFRPAFSRRWRRRPALAKGDRPGGGDSSAGHGSLWSSHPELRFYHRFQQTAVRNCLAALEILIRMGAAPAPPAPSLADNLTTIARRLGRAGPFAQPHARAARGAARPRSRGFPRLVSSSAEAAPPRTQRGPACRRYLAACFGRS